MKHVKRTSLDINKCVEDLMNQYPFEDIQKFYNKLDQEILKTELLQYMCKELNEDNLICPYCGSHHVHKNGKNTSRYTKVQV